MSPEFIKQWEHIIDDVDKQKVPVEFIKKLVIKLQGRKQHTINIEKILKSGVDQEEVENAISRKLEEFDDDINGIEFVLNVESIAETVQPETDKLLRKFN